MIQHDQQCLRLTKVLRLEEGHGLFEITPCFEVSDHSVKNVPEIELRFSVQLEIRVIVFLNCIEFECHTFEQYAFSHARKVVPVLID